MTPTVREYQIVTKPDYTDTGRIYSGSLKITGQKK